MPLGVEYISECVEVHLALENIAFLGMWEGGSWFREYYIPYNAGRLLFAYFREHGIPGNAWRCLLVLRTFLGMRGVHSLGLVNISLLGLRGGASWFREHCIP